MRQKPDSYACSGEFDTKKGGGCARGSGSSFAQTPGGHPSGPPGSPLVSERQRVDSRYSEEKLESLAKRRAEKTGGWWRDVLHEMRDAVEELRARADEIDAQRRELLEAQDEAREERACADQLDPKELRPKAPGQMMHRGCWDGEMRYDQFEDVWVCSACGAWIDGGRWAL